MQRKPEILIDRDRIAERIAALGQEIRAWYGSEGGEAAGNKPDPIVVVGVLKGSFLFMADLVRAIDAPVHCEFLGVSSYVGTRSSGAVQITQDLAADIRGKRVLLVEDIVDTGLTLEYLRRTLEARNPKSLKVVALLDKPSRRQVEVNVDLIGFTIDDLFVVGYGLDLDQLWRNLPYIGVFR